MVIYICISVLCASVLLFWKRLHFDDEKRLYFVLGAVVGVFGIVSMFSGGGEKLKTDERGNTVLDRREHGNGAYTKKLVLDLEGAQQEYSVRIEEEHLSDSEVNEVFISAIERIEKTFFGEGNHPDDVRGQVNLLKKIEIEVDADSKTGTKANVTAVFSFQPSGVVAPDGTLKDEKIDEDGTLIQTGVELSCDGRKVDHAFSFMAYPKAVKTTDDIVADIGEEIDRRNADEGELLMLPSEIDGVKVKWYAPEKSGTYNILLLGILAFAGIFVAKKEEKKKKQKERCVELERGYPMMVSALSLLIGSGMTVGAAWDRIVGAYVKRTESGRAREAVYEEMLQTSRQIRDGKSEKDSLTGFAERTGLGIYRKLISMILQNLRKGGRDLDVMLEREVENAYIMLRNQAKTKGAEASTKMLVPMMLSLLVVIVVIIVPAIFTMDV